MDGSPPLFESISARRTSGTTKSRSGKFWSKHPRAPLQQGSSRLQPPSVGKDSTQPCRHCGKSEHRPWKCDQHPRQQRKQRRSNPPAISFRTDGVGPPPSSQQRPATRQQHPPANNRQSFTIRKRSGSTRKKRRRNETHAVECSPAVGTRALTFSAAKALPRTRPFFQQSLCQTPESLV